MHFHVEVIVPATTTPTGLQQAVDRALARFEGRLWDWYQIGGRWKGAHVPGYDGDTDPAHKERCTLCKGTGKREDMEVENGCNSCSGTGIATTWPTQWKPHGRDAVPVAELPPELTAYAVVAGGELYCENNGYEERGGKYTAIPGPLAGKTVAQLLASIGVKAGFSVTVDCHN
jgi:hypothetical protein